MTNFDVRTLPFQAAPVAARRESVRLLPTEPVTARIPGLDMDLEVRDLSFGGFALLAPKRFWKGMTHQFTFIAARGHQVTLVAKAVRSYSLAEEGDQRFMTGWAFMAGSAERTEAAIGHLLDLAIDGR